MILSSKVFKSMGSNQTKVTVGHKKAPSSLIDDCIDKFRQLETERKRLRLLNGQRGSTESAPVDFLMGEEGDPLSSVLNKNMEECDGLGMEDISLGRCEADDRAFWT